MSKTRNLTIAMSMAAIGVMGLQASPAGASGPSTLPPHIVAHPKDPMVNTKILLTGTGFAPSSTLTVEECSSTSWLVPANPCDTSNTVKVAVSATGSFKRYMKAEFCPAISPGTSDTCYVGVPQPFGIDEVRLEGAAKITVTGP